MRKMTTFEYPQELLDRGILEMEDQFLLVWRVAANRRYKCDMCRKLFYGDEAFARFDTAEDRCYFLCESCHDCHLTQHVDCIKYESACADEVDDIRDHLRALLLRCGLYDECNDAIQARWYGLVTNCNS